MRNLVEKYQQQKVLTNKCSQNWGIYSVFGFVFCVIYYCCILCIHFLFWGKSIHSFTSYFLFVCIICVWPDQFIKNLPVYRVDIIFILLESYGYIMFQVFAGVPPVSSGQIFHILFIAVYCRYFSVCYFFCAPIAHAKISKCFWLISSIPLYIHIQNATHVNTLKKIFKTLIQFIATGNNWIRDKTKAKRNTNTNLMHPPRQLSRRSNRAHLPSVAKHAVSRVIWTQLTAWRNKPG